MSTGKSTSSQPQPNGTSNSTQHRTHNDGSSSRAFTTEQKDAVIRVRKCQPTAFYDILGLESERSSVTDAGIKKAYRKLSLLTHPDKNGFRGADEAFKMVSRAFQILSDPSKKTHYDTHGSDPDVRFNPSTSSPFSGASPFTSFTPRGARPMYEEEISPEELFRQFFGGGGFGGGPFGSMGGGMGGPGFVFNLGGGPGVRVHQFGGNRPRRRPPGSSPADAQGQGQQQQQATAGNALWNLLPLLIFFILPLLSSLLSGLDPLSTSSTRNLPQFSVDTPASPLTHLHTSFRLGIPYYIDPTTASELTSKKWSELDRAAESQLMGHLQAKCEGEQQERQRLIQEAQGWFGVDHGKLDEAERVDMGGCRRLVGLRRGWG